MNLPYSDTKALRFYQSLPHACSYLADQEASTLFLDPQQELSLSMYASLSHAGFRRSGEHIYRPHCASCNACKSVRLRVADFAPSKQQLRTLRRNQDLTWSWGAAEFKAEYYQLYERYLNSRHADGAMYPASPEQFRGFLVTDKIWASLAEFRDSAGRLVAVAAVDLLPDGLSAIYTFFDPQEKRRSLGVFVLLWEIQQAASKELDYVYLGYWIRDCKKMNYKQLYQPLEILDKQVWRDFKPELDLN